MIRRLQTAREIYRVGSQDELMLAHYAHIAQQRDMCVRIGRAEVAPMVRDVADVATACVNHGRWVTSCPSCSSGIAVTPGWSIACCFACGAVLNHVCIPEHVAEIASLLECRTSSDTQNWTPSETMADLARENAVHGVA